MVPLCAMLALQSSASASQLSSAQAKAAQLETQIQTTGRQIDALDQQYLAAQAKKASLDQQITATQAKISQAKATVVKDRSSLKAIALEAYVTDGSAATNPLFSGNQTQTAAATEFSRVAQGDLSTAMAKLQTAQNQLNAEQTTLRTQDQQATQAVQVSQQAYQQAQTLQTQQQASLAQVKGQVATLITQQQLAQSQADQRAAQARLAAAQAPASNTPAQTVSAPANVPPPPSAGGAGAAAVAAAESQIGVPYVWGGESPGVGFDCSGLTAWAWGQAGVSLPHFSGAQMADSTPVPISDLQPGDLLFYGPGGGTHVAMYIGGGQMIEAPYTGASVWITGVRLGTGFAGAGRP